MLHFHKKLKHSEISEHQPCRKQYRILNGKQAVQCITEGIREWIAYPTTIVIVSYIAMQ